MRKILEVEETFLLKGRGLVIAPQLPVVQDCKFIPFEAIIELVRPDGSRDRCQASFQLTHSRFYSGASGFKIDIVLLDVRKQQVPVGTHLYGGNEIFNALYHATDGELPG
jgi:hypothetical protein